MKVLLPVDGSEYTKRALAYIAAHDELLPGAHDYLVVTAVTPLPAHAARFLERSTIDDYYRGQTEQVLQPLRTFAEMQHWKLRETVVHGNAVDAIVETAEKEKPDIIVMGSHGHTALGGVVLGSVATGVLARCRTPVLLIR
jgi:nucleotide-binding universal stress UspA family protein